MHIRRNRGRVLVAVRSGELPGTPTDIAEAKSALAQQRIAQVTGASFTATVPGPDGSNGFGAAEHFESLARRVRLIWARRRTLRSNSLSIKARVPSRRKSSCARASRMLLMWSAAWSRS